MSRILILGAHGQIARLVTERLLKETDNELTLFLRRASRLHIADPARESVIEGDVNDYAALVAAMRGQDVVYANLGGVFEPMAANIVRAMDETGVGRLIYVTGLGLYHEVPGEFGRWNEQTCGEDVMDDTRRAAAIIEGSDVNYTIIRAAWMTNDPTVDYETTQKGEPFRGTIISRASIADYIMRLLADPGFDNHASVGINQPDTDGDRPMY
jgi:uncharacterized protein YbjT (DUF2867 family)